MLGIGRYARGLIDALDSRGDTQLAMFFRLSRLRRARQRLAAPSSRVTRHFFTESTARWQLAHYDVVHGLDARIPRCSIATVATVHDVFSRKREDFAKEHFRRKKLDRYADIAENATRIVVPTQAVLEELVGYYPAAKGRVHAVHHGIDPSLFEISEVEAASRRAALGLVRPYVLSLGPPSVRKNTVRLVQAFDRLAPDFPEHELVLSGVAPEDSRALRETIEALRARDRIRMPGYLDWPDLQAAYAGAEVFSFATLAEGFGIPLVEAQAVGTPVLASDQPVAREVGGDAPLYVDPESIEAIEAGLKQLLGEGETERAERIRGGRSWAGRFRWERAAAETLAVYREAIATHRSAQGG